MTNKTFYYLHADTKTYGPLVKQCQDNLIHMLELRKPEYQYFDNTTLMVETCLKSWVIDPELMIANPSKRAKMSKAEQAIRHSIKWKPGNDRYSPLVTGKLTAYKGGGVGLGTFEPKGKRRIHPLFDEPGISIRRKGERKKKRAERDDEPINAAISARKIAQETIAYIRKVQMEPERILDAILNELANDG